MNKATKQRLIIITILVIIAVAAALVAYKYYGTWTTETKKKHKKNVDFKIYWNIPSERCLDKFKVDLGLDHYPLIVNKGGNGWQGDNITIFYANLGLYPYIKEKTGKRINGGIPQLTNWDGHWKKVEEDIIKRIPNKNFSGLGVLDYEPWRPLYLRNFGKKRVYQKASIDLIKEKYSCINDTTTIKKLAVYEFNESAKNLMLGTLKLAQKLRPHAHWGYYHFIYCFKHIGEVVCKGKDLNDRLDWLMEASDAFYPTAYLHTQMNSTSKVLFVDGQIREMKRVRQNLPSSKTPATRKPTYMYVRIRFQEDYTWLSEMDLKQSIGRVYEAGLEGAVIWENHYISDSLKKCQQLKHYINNTLGPYLNNMLKDQ